jgi:hypothetical protein
MSRLLLLFILLVATQRRIIITVWSNKENHVCYWEPQKETKTKNGSAIKSNMLLSVPFGSN